MNRPGGRTLFGILAFVALLVGAPIVRAEDECRFKVAFRFEKLDTSDKGRHPEIVLERIAIVTDPACGDELSEGTPFTFMAGAFVVAGKLPAPEVAFGNPSAYVKDLDLDRTSFALADVTPFPSSGRLTIGSVVHDASVAGDYFTAQRARDSHSFSFGPVASAEADAPTEAANAFRLQYRYEYASALGKENKASVSAAVSIDTTNRENPDFVDDNSVWLKFQGGDYGAGAVIRRVQFFGEAVYGRAVHSKAQSLDASAGVEFRLPFVRSVSLFRRGSGRFIAPPLSLALSYGYRLRDASDQPSEQGGVLKGSASYRFYMFNKFRVELQYDYTHTDLADPSDASPQTQRRYRAAIAYLIDDRFRVQTSYEDGSIGPVLTNVKQYFIGVAFKDGI